MASVKLGAMVTTLAGKLGGHTFQRHGQMTIIRTSKWASAKSFLSSATTRLAFALPRQQLFNMSAADQLLYNGIAARLPTPDWDGNGQRLLGFHKYNQIQANRIKLGESTTLLPASFVNTVATPVLTVFVFRVPSGLIGASSLPNAIGKWTNYYVSTESVLLPATSLRELRQIGTVLFDSNFNTNSFQLYNEFFGGLVIGQQFWMGWQYVNDSGISGGVSSIVATVIAG